MANERTFLAWQRTSLALVAGGLAVTELLRPSDLPGARYFIGLPLIAIGAAIAWFSYRRWRTVEAALLRGEKMPSSALPGLLAATVIVGAIVAGVLTVA